MRAVIFANGELHYPEHVRALLRPDDALIAADGGARHCMALALSPAVVIGDFDSLSEAELAALQSNGAEIIRHPSNKDETDLELALLHAKQIGATEVVVLAALGARWDQTLANILLLTHPKLSSMHIELVEGRQRIYAIKAQGVIRAQPGDIVSLIPVGGDASGVITDGLKFPLNNETLYFGTTRGISNVLLNSQARVEVKHGVLLCVVGREVPEHGIR